MLRFSSCHDSNHTDHPRKQNNFLQHQHLQPTFMIEIIKKEEHTMEKGDKENANEAPDLVKATNATKVEENEPSDQQQQLQPMEDDDGAKLKAESGNKLEKAADNVNGMEGDGEPKSEEGGAAMKGDEAMPQPEQEATLPEAASQEPSTTVPAGGPPPPPGPGYPPMSPSHYQYYGAGPGGAPPGGGYYPPPMYRKSRLHWVIWFSFANTFKSGARTLHSESIF